MYQACNGATGHTIRRSSVHMRSKVLQITTPFCLHPTMSSAKHVVCSTLFTNFKDRTILVFLVLCCRCVVLCYKDFDAEITTATSHKSFFNLETSIQTKSQQDNYPHLRRTKRSVVFTPEEIDSMISLHQKYRGNISPEAANMEYMTWDEDLATMAVQYSEKCYWGHGTVPNISPYDSIGQNLWIRGGTTKQPNPVSGITAWHNEVEYYDFDTNSCLPNKQCGHYTQIVWASSTAVGCGIAFCEETENWGPINSWILTCHYGPAGNYAGSKPYTLGPSCTQCASHIGQCYDNMCRLCSEDDEECDCRQHCLNCGTVDKNTCTCNCPNGWYGPDCADFCEDWHSNCWKSPGWPGPQYCDAHPAIPNGCPKMCGICIDPDVGFLCGSWEGWSDWGACGLPCLESSRSRTGLCYHQDESTLNSNATCVGAPPVQSENCTEQICGLLASWGDWSEWSSCGTPCLGSNRTRTAVCVHPDPDYSANVTCQGEASVEVETCTEIECGLLATWGDWSEWSSCGTPCLESNRTRTAVCVHPDPDYSANVTCQGAPPLEVELCTENECGLLASWEDWSEWSSCGTPCLESNRTRTAVCAHPDPDYSANVTCQGVPPLEVETCTENECDMSNATRNNQQLKYTISMTIWVYLWLWLL